MNLEDTYGRDSYAMHHAQTVQSAPVEADVSGVGADSAPEAQTEGVAGPIVPAPAPSPAVWVTRVRPQVETFRVPPCR